MNLLASLLMGASEGSSRPALVAGERVVAYGALVERVGLLAAELRRTGIGVGDRVALVVPNGPAYVGAYYGILAAGAAVVPVNARAPAPEIRHVVLDCGVHAIVVDASARAEVRRGVADSPATPRIVALDDAPDGGLLAPRTGDEANATLDPTIVGDDDLAQISYTSGTTGKPKGVMLTHGALVRNAEAIAETIMLVASDRMLAVAPLVHILGCTLVMNATLRYGAAAVFPPAPDLDALLGTVAEQRCTVTGVVPTLLIRMLQHPRRYDLRSLRLALTGGAPCAPELLTSVLQELGVLAVDGYGMTEIAGGVSTSPPQGPRKPGSVGPPARGIELCVRDDARRPLEPGEVGELCVRGPTLMRGYYGQPAATAEAIVDGWYHTGDLGYVDADGYIFIVDRKKDIVLTSGFTVYPREVEEVLHQHAAVAEASVVGVPDPVRGEAVCACVALRPGAAATAAELIAHCKERLIAYKTPVRVELVEALPKSPSGKVLRRELREQLAARDTG